MPRTIYKGYFFRGPISPETKTTVKIENVLFAIMNYTYQLIRYTVAAL
jgi:hypothetical protein